MKQKDFNFRNTTYKTMDRTSKERQFNGRETFDINGTMIYRLCDSRDRTSSVEKRNSSNSPVSEFYKSRQTSQKFFKQRNEDKVDLKKFVNQNYLTAPKASVGMPAHKNYLITKE